MATWQPGAELGPYRLNAPIGAGGMGEVWKAHDTRLNRTVAIKRLTGGHSARFEREARAIAALNHPHICQIFDIGPDYLVLEYIEGKPLSGPLSPDVAVQLAIEVAGALEEAHQKGILHRDLKPGNILVTSKGAAKLLDFGLAKLDRSEIDTTMTLEGTVMGTASYMSPEQAQGKPLDERSEVFSFGAVLYEMLSGRRAFEGTSMLDILNSVVRTEPAPLNAPQALLAIVTGCLRKSPTERFQSMAEVRSRLAATATARSEVKQPSIAVLPFANLSADPEQEYFSDGLAEEIINALVQIPGLKVIARTSAFAFKGQNTDIRRIAETLGVAHILEGSVRKAGDRIRVTAQLITAADGSHLWSQRYDRGLADVFAVQDEIATAIASSLRVKLRHAPAAYVPRPEAYEALLKGRHHLFKLTPESMALSLDYLKKAVEIDSNCAAAYAWLGSYYFGIVAGALVASPTTKDPEALARAAALRALELDPTSPEAHGLLSAMAAVLDFDWAEAERQFVLATSGDAVSPEARRVAGFNYLLSAGRPREAARQMEMALQGDPLNSFIVMQLGICLHAAGDYERAFESFRHAVELDGRNWLAYVNQCLWFIERVQLQQAARAVELAHAITPGNGLILCFQAAVRKLAGDDAGARELLNGLGPDENDWQAPGLFSYYNVIQDFEKAAEWGAKALEQRDGTVPFVSQFSVCRGLRASPYWPKLAKMMNLPAW